MRHCRRPFRERRGFKLGRRWRRGHRPVPPMVVGLFVPTACVAAEGMDGVATVRIEVPVRKPVWSSDAGALLALIEGQLGQVRKHWSTSSLTPRRPRRSTRCPRAIPHAFPDDRVLGDELYALDPLGHLEADLGLQPQPQRRTMLDGQRGPFISKARMACACRPGSDRRPRRIARRRTRRTW